MNTADDKRSHARLSNMSHGIRLSRIAVALGIASFGFSVMHPAAAFTTSTRNARLFEDNTAAPASNGNQPGLPSQASPGGTTAPAVNTGVQTGGGGQPQHMTGYRIHFGRDVVQIMGNDPKPDTLLTFNGASKRFGQLPKGEQDMIKEALKSQSKPDAQGPAASSGGDQQDVVHEYEFHIGNDVVQVTGTDPKPSTLVTVNGASKRFDQLPQDEQVAIVANLKSQPKTDGGDSVKTGSA